VTKALITENQFAELAEPLIGLPISRVWRGYGSALFLEIGALTEKVLRRSNGTSKISSEGQFGIMIDWSWRVERPRSIYFGSWSSDRIIDNRLNKLQGKTIIDLQVEGRLPELVVTLSGGLWVCSFATVEGQPEWCLFLNDRSPREWLGSEQGRLIKEISHQT
jgi:hypothetical protein